MADKLRDEVIADLLARGKPIAGWMVGHVTLREIDADELECILPAARRRLEVSG